MWQNQTKATKLYIHNFTPTLIFLFVCSNSMKEDPATLWPWKGLREILTKKQQNQNKTSLIDTNGYPVGSPDARHNMKYKKSPFDSLKSLSS